MPEVLDWPGADASAALQHDLVRRARQHLASGRVVIVPSTTGYDCVASALHFAGPRALSELPGALSPMPLLLGQTLEIFDWLPFFRGAGARLVRRFWDGPLILVSNSGVPWGLERRLAPEIRACLSKDDCIALRGPEHAVLREVLLEIDHPLVALPCPIADPSEWTSNLERHVGLLIREGAQREGASEAEGSPTVVYVNGLSWRVLHSGAITVEQIADTAPCTVLFVCTGNTCRSPLAEVLCKRMLSDKLGCDPEQLAAHGFRVESAGLAAQAGWEAASEAVAVAQAMGADLSRHCSQPVNAEQLARADFLLTMTHSQLRVLQGLRLGIEPRLLSSQLQDIDDPLGGTLDVYEDCARQIHTDLLELLPEFLEG